jgi:hypothetical protein
MSSKLLSFDVGIKNLAYCILDLSQNRILDWNVLNLCETTNSATTSKQSTVVQKCTQIQQNGKCCSLKAKYHKNGSCHTCEKHAKVSTQFIIPTKEYSSTCLKKRTIEGLQELRTKFQLLENPFKKTELYKLLWNHIQAISWELLPTVKNKNASKLDLITIGRSLHRQLIDKPIMKTITHVIIENQISPIANRMKTIQGMLAQHFISLGISSIEFVSSTNKLKDFVKQSEAKTNYKQNKHDGIFYGQKILEEKFGAPQEWVELFQKSPKKDDLADCLLQGLWWWDKHFSQGI